MNDVFDVAPFPYVGNNKHYRDLSKNELDKLKVEAVKENPVVDEVEENAIVNMLPQVELEEPNVEDVLADAEEDKIENLVDDEEIEDMQLDDEFDLLKESLNDEVNGVDIYFESSKIMDSLKAKFKKTDDTEAEKIEYPKIMNAAKAYTDLKFVDARKKLAITKDASLKDSIMIKKYQKKAVAAEKTFRKLKAALSPEELKILTKWIDDEFDPEFATKIQSQIKDIEDAKKAAIKTESCQTECGDSEIVTERDIDPGMKPILDKLHSKGYKTKASSSGHKNVSTKNDGDEDNVGNGHHYGDARLVFDGKYNLGKAPKYWYWKKVDNSDEVEYLDIMQIKADEWPDKGDKFAAWKAGYMKSLTDWVDGLPNISGENKEVEEACCRESEMTEAVENVDEQIDALYESVIGSLILDILDI